jgi:NADH-quinone oxidoreductase subunit A
MIHRDPIAIEVPPWAAEGSGRRGFREAAENSGFFADFRAKRALQVARQRPIYCAAKSDRLSSQSIAPAAALALGSALVSGLMNSFLLEYLPILLFLGISVALGLALMVVPLVLAPRKPDPEKLSAYECGFNAFDDARMKFDVRFYLVSILFIIFDLEVAFLFPWAISLKDIGAFGFWSMVGFLAVLTVGFIYEWKKGALEWE